LHILCIEFIDVNDCAAGHVLTASIVVVAVLGDSYLHCEAQPITL
jgi:hypothetical protein